MTFTNESKTPLRGEPASCNLSTVRKYTCLRNILFVFDKEDHAIKPDARSRSIARKISYGHRIRETDTYLYPVHTL